MGRDSLQFSVGSNAAGYVYVFATGADASQLTLLFPNALDPNNRIAAGAELSLPRAAWKYPADAPAGTRSILTVVSTRPRDLQAAGWKRGSTYSSYALVAGNTAASAGPALLGAPVCDAGAPCDAAYGAAMFQVDIVDAPVVADEPKRPVAAPPKRTAASEAARVAKPSSDNARQCALLLQQASMGQDTPEITRKMAELRCH